MLDLSAVFDPHTVRRPASHRLLSEAWSVLAYRPAEPPPDELPDGAGRPVLIVPAFLSGDRSTRALRAFLARCGFRSFGWEQGVNWGPTPRLLAGLDRRLSELRGAHSTVALVGISLGGLLARHLAQRRPDDVRHVITVASPFRLPTASPLEPMVRLCARHYSATLDPIGLKSPLSVPSTMIWTRDDGIVAPQSCWTDEAEGEIVTLRGAHLTLASNPQARRAIVRRLAAD